MNYTDLVGTLTAALKRPLPGIAAQALMAPRPRGSWPAGSEPDRLRHAAGLLLVYPVNAVAHIVLTLRSDRVRHSGQVSLPGGVVEPGETLERAALREAHEEVGVPIEHVSVLGALTPLDIPVSGFRLHPIVAALDDRPVLRPSDVEVARVLEVPLATLMDDAIVESRPMMRGRVAIDAPAFITHDVVIWGATAMVLAEFLTLLGWNRAEHWRS